MRTSLWLTSAFIALVAVGCDDDGNVADSTDDMGNVGEHDGAGGSRVDGDVPDVSDPDVSDPDMDVIDPDMEVVDPDMEVVDPDMAVDADMAIDPDMVVEPDVAIEPDMVVDPDMVVEPDVLEPDMGPQGLVCPEDDPFEQNDDIENASDLPEVGSLEGIACPNDADYYLVAAQAGCTITVDLGFRHAEGDLDLRLRNAQGGSLARGATASDDELVEYDVGEDGDYFVEVRHAVPDDDGTRYDLDVQVVCPQPLDCPGDDDLEENDNRQTATPLAEDGVGAEGVLCEGDPDFFLVQLGPECTVVVELELDAGAGNLDLVLRDAQGEEISRSEEAGDRERLDFVAGPGGDTLYAQVVGEQNSYRIRASQDCPIIPVCPEDDVLEDNDDLETASRVEAGDAVNGIICGADADWFAVEVPPECALNVALDFAHAQGDLDLHVHDADCGVFAESVGAIDGEELRLDDAGGTWFLRVDLKNEGGANRYRLRTSVDCPGALRCPDDDGFEENDAPGDAPVLPAGVPIEAIACLADPDFYALQVPRGCDAVAVIDHDADARLALDVVDADGNLVAAGRATPDGAEARHFSPEEARVYFEVRARDIVPNDYTLDLAADCPDNRCPVDDAAEPNNDRGDATPLFLPTSGVVCGDDADWFEVEAEAGCVLRARVEPGPGDGELELTALDGDGELARARGGADGSITLDQALEAGGAHFLRLANLGGTGQGSYTVSATIECVLACPVDDAFEDNDDVGSATPLEEGEAVDGIVCGDDVDVFAIDIDAGCRALARLAHDDDANLRLRLLDADGGVLAGVQDGALAHNADEDATLYFEVGGGENDYSLQVDIDCPDRLNCEDDDAFEENDGPEAATPLENGAIIDAVVCGRDHDWFTFEGGGGCELTAELRFTDADGDVDVRLYDDPFGIPLRSSTTATDNERIAFELPADGTYFLDVVLFGDGGNDYELDLQVDCPEPLRCPEDDDLEDNDDIASSTALEGNLNRRRGVACHDDPDYYALELAEGCSLQADVRYDRDSELVVELRDGGDAVVVEGAQANDGQVLFFDAPAAGDYHVYVAGDGVEYRLETEVDCRGVLSCPDDDGFEDNDNPVTASFLPPGGVVAILCGGDADYWRPPIEIGCRLEATLEIDHAAGDLDLAIVDNQGEVLDESNGQLDTERVSAPLQHVGPFALRVTGKDGANNVYRISAELDCSCEEDDLEDNDDAGEATVMGDDDSIQARACGFDEDWFLVETVEDCIIEADLRFAQAGGNLDLELRDADGARLTFSRSSTDDESIEHRPDAGPGLYYLKVSLRNGIGGNDYQLDVGLDCTPPPPDCFDDIFEDNNGPGVGSTALPISQVLQATACRDDADWFRFQVLGDADACEVDASLFFDHDDGNLAFALLDGDGGELVSVDSPNDDETISRLLEPGTYHLRVQLDDGESDGNNYGILVEANCQVEPVCEEDALEDNDAIGTATALDEGQVLAARLCGADDDYFVFDAPIPGCEVTATMIHANADGDLDLRLLNAQGNGVDSSETAADVERITTVLDDGGVHYLRVYIFGGLGENDYSVEVALDCPIPLECPGDDEYEENDAVDQARQLAEGVPVEGILCPQDADYYGIGADADCTITATLEFSHADGNLGLVLLDDGGAEVAAVDTGDDGEAIEQQVAGGGYVLQVTGAENEYILAVDVTCPDDLFCPDDDEFEENDNRGTASPVDDGAAVRGVLCGAEEADYYAIEVEVGCVLSGNLAFTHAFGDLNLRVEDEAGNVLESSRSDTDDEAIEVPAAATGTYFLRVDIDDFGGSDQNDYTLTASIDCPLGELIINEVDYDQPGADAAEFIEIYSSGAVTSPLAGVELEFVDAGGGVYATIDLSAAGERLEAGQYLVIGHPPPLAGLLPEVLRIALGDVLQDGPSDGLRLVRRGDVDEVLDSVSWEGVLDGVTEGEAGIPADEDNANSVGRCANGQDTDANDLDFALGAPSPGLPNVCPLILACPGDDQHEENDVPLTAAIFHLGGGAYDAISCGDDPDYYQFDADVGCFAVVSVTFAHADGNLDLVVVNGDGDQLGASRSDTDNENVRFRIPDPGPFYPLVTERDGAGDTVYQLDVVFDCPEGNPEVVINEIDYLQPGPDSRELVELYSSGDIEVSLAGYELDLVGPDGAPYATLDVGAIVDVLAPGEFLVIGNARSLNVMPDGTPSLFIPDGTLRNGVGGLVLRAGNVVVDSMSHMGAIDGVSEGAGFAPEDDPAVELQSVGRCPDGQDTDDNAADFVQSLRTPGRANICQ